MFGDNLSFISDTTIAAARGQGVEMKDKFRLNFLIALPAALVTLILLCIVGRPETVVPMGDLSYNLIKVVPYLIVLVAALAGVDVMLSLAIGIGSAGVIPTAIGVIAAMVPIEVPQAVLMSIAMMKQPATRNCVGTKDRPRFTTASRPPLAVATAENAPDRAKITSMMITPSSATPRANTENFSLILPFP